MHYYYWGLDLQCAKQNKKRSSFGQGHHLQSPDAVIKIKLQDLSLIMVVIIEVISVIILRSRRRFL